MCGNEKPRSAFTKNKTKRGGIDTRCKACNNAAAKTHYKTNLEAGRKARRLYGQQNKQAARERHARWAMENAERLREYQINYHRGKRARKKAAPGSHTLEDVAKQFDAQKGRCWWCGSKLRKSGKERYHVDHVVPLSKGGGDGPDNIVCSCPRCNRTKNARTALEFAGRLF